VLAPKSQPVAPPSSWLGAPPVDPRQHDSDHVSVGVTDLLVVVLVGALVLSGLTYFFSKILGHTMAIRLSIMLTVVGFLWVNWTPTFAILSLVILLPLTVGIVRGMESKPKKKGSIGPGP